MNKCLVCRNETNRKYLDMDVCSDCYENGNLQIWLNEQSQLSIIPPNNFDEIMNNISEHKKRCFIWYLLGSVSGLNKKYDAMTAEKMFTSIYSDFDSDFKEAGNND